MVHILGQQAGITPELIQNLAISTAQGIFIQKMGLPDGQHLAPEEELRYAKYCAGVFVNNLFKAEPPNSNGEA